MKVVAISDTHLPRRAKRLPDGLLLYLKAADLILHAGDLMDPALLDELETYAPTLAVCGNLDPPDSRLPETREFGIGEIKVAMIHDSGRREGRARRMRRQFPEARVVVFGHSHIPLLQDDGDLMLLNPGSPTDKRRQPDFTFAVLEVENGALSTELVRL
ncbi:metallophosphoesterase family protein [Rubrobacter indicoceani]|uniref:metallophosphoesterase family protein n=1 Tax=Rubrobacter indicoceani TaxID=2051957 RepID=UPI000E5B2152|nr:metallophosphoesterase family protein [Rubrobacter indicoceani]